LNGGIYDAAIVGGGPAGLACGLWLGRYRRSVRIFDTREPRNRPAWAVHGYPGLPDPPPLELRERIRHQAIHAGAEHAIGEIVRIGGEKDAWELEQADGTIVMARRVVLAYGLRDFVPDVPDIRAFYGHSVYHCPDCDGPSVLGMHTAVIGHDRHAAALALYLLTWAQSVSILPNGLATDFTEDAAAMLAEQAIEVKPGRISSLSGEAGRLREVVAGDVTIPLEAIFFHLGSEQNCNFAADLGCELDEDGYVSVSGGQQTSVSGIYAAGDIAGHPHLAVVAAAEGVRAALAIHRSLTPDRFFVGGQ
jgi:thioredoxin reductase